MNATAQLVVEAPRLSLGRRLAAHLRRSLPPLSTTLVGSACWALIMTASALLTMWTYGWQTPGKYETVALLYAFAAAMAFPPGLTLARVAALGRSAETAFASMFLALSLSTAGVTAALFALQYRQYYATWHADFLTITWGFQLVFTALTALVQFAVLGTRLFFPLGFVALFLASLWFVRQPR